MKLNYRQKLFLYFGIIFGAFTTGITIFEQLREKELKTIALEEKLEVYTDFINEVLAHRKANIEEALLHTEPFLPKNLRITLISDDGEVLFDNSIRDFSTLDNHLHRPEIQSAIAYTKGADIRRSDSNERKYLYFAKRYNNIFIRAALPYNVGVHQFIKPDNASLLFILLFFIIFLFFIHIATKNFERSIRQLRDFALDASYLKSAKLRFPKNELGEIGSKIADNYRQLKESERKTVQEKQKLLRHIQILEEGICFFSSDCRIEFYNHLFIQYLNTVADESTGDAAAVLHTPVFFELQEFLSHQGNDYLETKIAKQGKTFSLRANKFEDGSFEVTLSDITKLEKTRLLKQEMTHNIAHELRTPVTSIRGYLETVMGNVPDEEKRNYFIEKAFHKTVMLSAIIQDMSQLAKMEETPESFSFEQVNIGAIVRKIKTEFAADILLINFDVKENRSAEPTIDGNEVLLYSLFRNLIENAVRYAGERVKIVISLYNEDPVYYYFSFYDNGPGVPDENQLNRIFERFYRVDEGRTREKGGLGLGLSIVKNAVVFHKGKIIAKNRKDGGLEFLFSLRKRKK